MKHAMSEKFNIRRCFAAFFFLFFCYSAFTQEIIDEEFLDKIDINAKELWYDDIPAFRNNIVPDKYRNESAVILGYRRNVSIDKKSRSGFLTKGERSLVFIETVRFKIKLNDRSSIKSFSKIFFRFNDKMDGFSAKVLKPDGKEYPVSLNDAVGVESTEDVPEFFRSFFDQENNTGRNYYTVPIPNLGAGDILEYATITKSKLDVMGTGYIEFAPQYELCSKKFPVLFNQITIETDEKSYFKAVSINGAPEFVKQSANDPEFFRYVFTDIDRAVEKDVNFVNRYATYPMVKFQIIYSNKDNIKGALIGARGEIKKSFSKEEFCRKAWDDYAEVGETYYPSYGKIQKVVDELWIELKGMGARNWSEKEFIEKTYYRLRNLVVNNNTYLSDKVAAYIFGSLLFQRDINSELIVAVPNSIGKVSDILFNQEIRYIIKVGNNYYFNCTDHSNPEDLVEVLLGTEGYVISEPPKNGPQPIKTINLPDAAFTDNKSHYVIQASLYENMRTLGIVRTSSHYGISRSREAGSANRFTSYVFEDFQNYGGHSPVTKLYSSQRDEYYKYVYEYENKAKEAKQEFVQNELRNDFRQSAVLKKFTLINDGRSAKQEHVLTVKEEFDLPDMVRKAGKKYLINLSGLVGSQLQIKPDERQRKLDIDVGYARIMNWEIRFVIPKGFSVMGLQELEQNIENDAGLYKCMAEEKDGTVILNITKAYKKANLPKEKWTEMMGFIDMAYNNTFRYILLQPKN